MKLLLDTHVLLWWLAGSPKLGRVAREAIESEHSAVWVSAATAWEVAIKVGLGRLALGEPPETCVPRELERSGFHPLSVSILHALAVRSLKGHHSDPFDRLLIAQAKLEQLTVVTADDIFAKYGIDTLDATT